MTNYDKVIDYLTYSIPKSSILLGCKDFDGVISQLVEPLCKIHGIGSMDVISIEKFSSSFLLEVKEFCKVMPLGPLSLLVADLRDSSVRSQDALLSLLESTNGHRFLLIGNGRTLSTIRSRSFIFDVADGTSGVFSNKELILNVLKASRDVDYSLLEELTKEWSKVEHKTLRQLGFEFVSQNYKLFEECEIVDLGLPSSFGVSLLTLMAT